MKAGGLSLVLGADGFIGRALADHLERAGEAVLETTRRHDTLSERRAFLDLTEDVSDWLPSHQISAAYFCAAVSSLERCRREPVQSAKVNVHNTVAMAQTLVANGTFVIFLSTNLVYDGSIPFPRVDDPVYPVTEYGRQKAQAEGQLLALGDLVSVVRLTKVIGPDMPLFKEWIQALENHQTIHPFSDMIMAPVPLAFVVCVLHRIATERVPGIMQVSGTEDISYAEAACFGARLLGANPALIQSIKVSESGCYIEHIPAHTTLNMDRLKSTFGLEPPDVWWAVETTVFSSKMLGARHIQPQQG